MVSKTVIVVFSVLFLSLLALLILLTAFGRKPDVKHAKEEKDEGVVKEDDSGLDLDHFFPAVERCSRCRPLIEKDLVCGNGFALLIKVQSLDPTDPYGLTTAIIELVEILKGQPTLMPLLSRHTLTIDAMRDKDMKCRVDIVAGNEYLVTGSIDDSRLRAVVSSCDLVLNWKRLNQEMGNKFRDMFRPPFEC